MGKKENLKFALLLEVDDFGYPQLRFDNSGIPEGDLILYLETWLEYTKENLKDKIRDGFFGAE